MSVAAARIASALAIALASCLGSPPIAHAAGYYLQEQSARAVGRAFSGEAADEGPASLWWNPAAIAGAASVSGYIGVSGILPSGTVSDTGTLIVRPGQAAAGVGGEPVFHDPVQSGAIPSGAIAVPVGHGFALGLALTTPFDFTTQYDAQSWTRYSALRTRLRTIDLQPSLALRPADWLSLGVALDAERAEATLSNALPNLSPLLPDGLQVLKGSGWDIGWSAGAQLHSGPVTLGVSYRSSIRHTLDGTIDVSGLLGPLAPFNFSAAAQARYRTPWQVVAGARFKATDRLTLDLQGARLGWGEFDVIRLGPPVDAALPEGYHDAWSVAGGFDYGLDPRWTVRAGVQYDQTPTTDGQRDARVPDADRVDFAVGGSYQPSDHFTLDAGLIYVHFQDAAIDRPTAAFAGTPAQTPILTSGRLTGGHAFVLSAGARFSF